ERSTGMWKLTDANVTFSWWSPSTVIGRSTSVMSGQFSAERRSRYLPGLMLWNLPSAPRPSGEARSTILVAPEVSSTRTRGESGPTVDFSCVGSTRRKGTAVGATTGALEAVATGTGEGFGVRLAVMITWPGEAEKSVSGDSTTTTSSSPRPQPEAPT